MGKSSQEEREDRVEYTAQAMIQLRNKRAVERDVCAKFKVTSRTVRTWIALVRQRRREEQTQTDVDTARDGARADLNAVIALALNQRTIVKTKDGDPVLDPATNKPITRPTPDLRTAVRAMKQLHDLDGLAQPMKTEVKIEGEVHAMPDLGALDEAALKALTKAMEAISPDGDIGKLIGEHFKLAGGGDAAPIG